MLKITKKHKLFYRTEKGELRNLQRANIITYLWLIDQFLNKGWNQIYFDVNKDVKKWNQFKPLVKEPPAEIKTELQKLTKGKAMTFYYNGSWKPLINLINIQKNEPVNTEKAD